MAKPSLNSVLVVTESVFLKNCMATKDGLPFSCPHQPLTNTDGIHLSVRSPVLDMSYGDNHITVQFQHGKYRNTTQKSNTQQWFTRRPHTHISKSQHWNWGSNSFHLSLVQFLRQPLYLIYFLLALLEIKFCWTGQAGLALSVILLPQFLKCCNCMCTGLTFSPQLNI